MRIYAGIDGGGTSTTVALVEEGGRELLRVVGPASIVDPRCPERSADTLTQLLRDAMRDAGLTGPVTALCAGLAGVGNPPEREAVRAAFERAAIADHILVVNDGEIALEGAFPGRAGILVVSGTGSVAYGRGEQGWTQRCGGWGMFLGDEGSGYWIGRTALQRALQAEDGRGPPTRLLAMVLHVLELPGPDALPSWAGRVPKREVAALVPHVRSLAKDGDPVADAILQEAAHAIAAHVTALRGRLGVWSGVVPVVLWGGVGRDPGFQHRVGRILASADSAYRIVEPAGDAVTGAIRLAVEHKPMLLA
jgi:glucosamine kinase